MIIFDAIIETNAVTVVLLADGSYLARVNGNIRPLSHVQHLMAMEAFRASRGPITA